MYAEPLFVLPTNMCSFGNRIEEELPNHRARILLLRKLLLYAFFSGFSIICKPPAKLHVTFAFLLLFVQK